MSRRSLISQLATLLCSACLLHGGGAWACKPLPAPRPGPYPFPVGEVLTFDIDVNGVRAATMTYETLPRLGTGDKAATSLRGRIETNTFFRKVREVKGEVVSTLRGTDLRPVKFVENMTIAGVPKKTSVDFSTQGGKRVAQMAWSSGTGAKARKSNVKLTASAPDVLDYSGALGLIRAMPLKVGDSYCFEVFSMRRLWKVEGTVSAREEIESPVGVFKALHLKAPATALGPGKDMTRDVHLWLTDDDKRLPLAALGAIDLGAVRATLTRVSRPDMKAEAPKPGNMDW